jgi:hypothetical protein
VFTVTGTIRGRPAAVEWTDGHITGHDLAISEIESLIAAQEQLIQSAATIPAVTLQPGNCAWPRPLQSPPPSKPDWVALRAIIAVFDPQPRIHGDVSDPPWYSDPENTIY